VRAPSWILLLACSSAYADETSGITANARHRWEHQQEPLLHLDEILPVNAEGVGARTERETHVLDLGPRARMALESEWWKSTLTPQLFGPDVDDIARGWHATYELSYDLGWFRLGANLSVGEVDTRYERGMYQILGVSAYRTFRISRWMLAWISVGVWRQQWFGAPPPGESNSTTVGLSLGATFR
jgi:hypothetical protein